MVLPAVPWVVLATLVTCRSAAEETGTVNVVVLLGVVGSGVVLVPTAVSVTRPVVAVTVALTTSVRVPPTARVVVVAAALAPAIVVVTLLLLELMKVWPADRKSVTVTFCATLGPRLTSVTV